jgi:hypothetical protein
MTTLNTKLKLVHWFKQQIWSHKDKIPVPYAIQVQFEILFFEFEFNGYLDLRNLGVDMLSEWWEGFLYTFVNERNKTVTVSKKAVWFIGDILAEATGNGGGPISFSDFVRICLRVLHLKSDDLVIAKKRSGNYLTDSKNFMRKYNVRVKIPLDSTKDF